MKEYKENHFICIVFISRYTLSSLTVLLGTINYPILDNKAPKITGHIIFPQIGVDLNNLSIKVPSEDKRSCLHSEGSSSA